MEPNLEHNGVSVKVFVFCGHPINADFSAFFMYVKSTMNLPGGAPGFQLACCHSNTKAEPDDSGFNKGLGGGAGEVCLSMQTGCDPV